MTGFSEMDRRAMLQRAFALVGASAAGGLSAPAIAGAAADKQLLDQKQFNLLSAVADTIVPETDTPGAIAAKVPATIDGLLRNWASAKRREGLIGALKTIDAGAKEKTGKGFVELPPAERTTYLTAWDIAALKPAPKPPATDKKAGGIAAMMSAAAAVADPDYAKLKELVVLLYYLSEIGLTKELVYEHAPGAWQPSVKITPETRPAGGSLY